MKLIHKNKDITQLVGKLTWSGDSKQVARVLDFDIVSTSTDKNIPVVNFKMGDMIILKDDKDKELFRGYVFKQDKSLTSNNKSITCYDGLIYLLKSKGTYNFKNVTPGSITRKMCTDFGIIAGNIINGSPIKRIFDAENIYNIIMTAYTFESSKTKKLYMPKMNKGKLDIVEKGKVVAKYELDNSTSITNANYGESIENSINRVKMYDENNKYIGQVTLNGVPGILQDVYKKAEGENAKQMATTMLKGIEQTASIDALGDFDCITGNAVVIKEPHTGLMGLFYIDNDEHKFENGQHFMSLGLAFKNIMDRQEAGQEEEKKEEVNKPNKNTPKKSTSASSNKLDKFIQAAQSMIGFSYSQANRMGRRSADCSSLVGRAMKMAGITNNAQLTTRSILNDSRFTKISKSSAKKGDILWEKGHMGIYMGGNRTLEARWSTKKVGYSSLGNRFSYAYRIKGV